MDILGLSIDKVLVLGVLAGVLLGPDRLARIVAEGSRMLQTLRRKTDGARDAIREELGPEVADIDWQRLDPRQYDPRRIIADALLAPTEPSPPTPPRARTASLDAAPAVAGNPEERK